MERLTESKENYYGEQQKIRKYCYMGFDGDCKYPSCAGCAILKLYRKLAEFEDLAEQGRLIELPCKVGDTLYDIYEFIENRNSPEIYEYKAKEITVGKDKQGDYFIIDSTIFRVGDFGKTVFLTKEEAEKAIENND